VRPLPDGKAPGLNSYYCKLVKSMLNFVSADAPEGFSIVLKDNGLMVLKKKRYRDLKKVGIGGFQAKTRMLNKKNSKEDLVRKILLISLNKICNLSKFSFKDDDKPSKRRNNWKPKKNKLLAQYPEYIQVNIKISSLKEKYIS